ncbi:holo-ACP synthase [Salimicrobium humidisoli]|uniref:Holo-[acyl-carrier-protein] synthase n=1 Tax=Salimicrobium humidisoli TaxID=2029857 RepID=A0ABX4HT44_9BACI|nr:holo-ACP synthase [Salimicrobium humidisoli]PBB06060.1 holo-[acyl-carrier-protein] synthase [Salimicrobium humidisoli]
MITGIGIDVVEIDRITKSIKRNPRIIQRILTDQEQRRYCSLSEKRKKEFMAGRFAVKEAVGKALGTGVGRIGFRQIETAADDYGKPVLTVKGREDVNFFVSISHSEHYAVANVVVEKI